MSPLASLSSALWLVLIMSIAFVAVSIWRRSRNKEAVNDLVKKSGELAKIVETDQQRRAAILRNKPVIGIGGGGGDLTAAEQREFKSFHHHEFELKRLRERRAEAEARISFWGVAGNVASVLGIVSFLIQIAQFLWVR